jgi:hypothetical protein
MLLKRWSSWSRSKQRDATVRHVGPSLEDGEEVEIAINGAMGTIEGGSPAMTARGKASPALYLNVGRAIDPYEVVLTNRRLLALESATRPRTSARLVFACERGAAQVGIIHRRLLADRVQFAFPDAALSLTVQRIFRSDINLFVDEVGDHTPAVGV